MAQKEGSEGPLFKGEATDVQWLCGACGKVLVDGVEPGRISQVVLRCTCGAYNDGSI